MASKELDDGGREIGARLKRLDDLFLDRHYLIATPETEDRLAWMSYSDKTSWEKAIQFLAVNNRPFRALEATPVQINIKVELIRPTVYRGANGAQ